MHVIFDICIYLELKGQDSFIEKKFNTCIKKGSIHDRTYGSMFGALIGDAIGSIL